MLDEVVFGIAIFSLVFTAIGFLTPVALRFGLVDHPGGRKHHKGAVPLVGGIAIYLSLLVLLITIGFPEKILWLAVSSSLIVLTGLIDDARGLGVKSRVILQVLATISMIYFGELWIKNIGIYSWPESDFFGVAFLLTVIAVIGLTNAINLSDGIDGLAATTVIVSIALLVMTANMYGEALPNQRFVIGFGVAIFAFLIINLGISPLQKVFLGDAGSLLLGYIVSWILIYYSQSPINGILPVAALWCVGILVFDTISVIAIRVIQGRTPFSPDRIHLHHRLIDKSWSQKSTLVVIFVITSLTNGLGIIVTYEVGQLAGFILFFLCLALYITRSYITLVRRGCVN